MNFYLPKILITGGQGQVAQALRSHVLAQQFELNFFSHQQLDITHSGKIDEVFAHYKPDMIINTAAYTAVDKAETEQKKALQVNYLGAKNLALACDKFQIPLIHLSTDYVFAGNKNSAYLENDPINPINFYGHSKQLGEEAIKQYLDNYIILRVSSVFSEYGHNFVKTILRLAQEKNELRIVDDQISCPTYAGDIAATIFELAKLKNFAHSGIYHFCSEHAISWYEFAKAIIASNQRSVEVKPIKSSEYKTAARRPAYSVLSCGKISAIFNVEQPQWELGLEKMIHQMI